MIRAALVCSLLTACSSPPKCTGCLDSASECRAGSARSACGVDGVACTSCSGVQICRAGACADAPDGGTGGGSGGGGGGTGGGAPLVPPYSCGSTRTVPSFDGPIVAATYDPAGPDAYATIAVTSDAGIEQLTADGFFDFTGSLHHVPGVTDLDGGDKTGAPLTYRQCGACVTFYESCPSTSTTNDCGRKYFGMSGRVDFQQISRGMPGTMVAQLTGVTFVEWDFVADRPVADAGCVVMQSAIVDAGWP